MRIIKGVFSKVDFKSPVVTIGNFDGLHLGHQEIISVLKKEARSISGQAVVVTFSNHPQTIINPLNKIFYITTFQEKMAIFKSLGVDKVVLLNFTKGMAQMKAEDFYRKILIDKIGAHKIVVGYDHNFGKNKEGGFNLLSNLAKKDGLLVKEVKAKSKKNNPISSTLIRQKILSGNFLEVNKLLGRPFQLAGRVIFGKKRGSVLGFPTANISLGDSGKIVPNNGVYAVEVFIPKLNLTRKGMLNIGFNPTFNNSIKTLEVNIFSFRHNIYRYKIIVKFYKKIREEKKFNSAKLLVKQLEKDKIKVRTFFDQ